MTLQFNDNFWAELDRDFYKKFPEEWDSEGDFFVKGITYTEILQGKRNSSERDKNKGEKLDNIGIKRDGYYVWKIGKTYLVKPHDKSLRTVLVEQKQNEDGTISETHSVSIVDSDIIGKLKLVAVKEYITMFELFFEVVENYLEAQNG